MKKIIIAISICVLLLIMPTTISISTKIIKTNKNQDFIKENHFSNENRPLWAQGNFTGYWGLNIVGELYIPLGKIIGYYSIGYHSKLKRVGYFQVDFKEFDDDNVTRLKGFFWGDYMIGKQLYLDSENTTAIAGLGRYNETNSEFFWRVMAIKGPTYFMWGNSAKFN